MRLQQSLLGLRPVRLQEAHQGPIRLQRMQREEALPGRPVLLPGPDGPVAISGDARLLQARHQRLTRSDCSAGRTADPSDQEEPVRQPYLWHTPRGSGHLQKHLLQSFTVHLPEYRPSSEGPIQAAKEKA